MVTRIPTAILKGDQGESVAEAVQPEPGSVAFELTDGTLTDSVVLPRGERGLPGVNGLPADEAVAEYLAAEDSASGQVAAGRFVSISRRPVNLGDRLPASHATSDPADAILAEALSEGGAVEWPEGLALTLVDGAGVTVAAGQTLRAGRGAKALVSHAGDGFKVRGALEGLEVEYSGGSTLADVAVHLMPGTARASARGVKVTGGAACFAMGGNELTGSGDAGDAYLEDCQGETSVASSYVYRVDESMGVELAHCLGLGSKLDSIKLRKKARKFRVNGGRYTGAVAGDGLDGFAGAVEAYVGGGVVFHGNVQNGFVFKTDDFAGMSQAEQAAAYGVPKNLIIDGVISVDNGGNGASLHRSDSTDSDVAAGTQIPWLRSAIVSDLIASRNGAGVFANLRAADFSGLMVGNNQGRGFDIHANARDITMRGVHAFGNGTSNPGNFDNFYLAGQRLWLAQCMAYGVDPDAVTDADLAAATSVTRFGFRIPTGAKVRSMMQCGSYYHATAPLSDSDGATALIDCDFPALTGASSIAGVMLSTGESISYRDAGALRRAIRLSTPGAAAQMTIGDNGADGLTNLILAARANGSVISTASLNPQAHNVYDLGLNTVRWRDIQAGRYVKVGSITLRDNAGALEKSNDNGATWVPA